MQIKEFWKKLTAPPRKTVRYQTIPTRNFYNSILTADVFEKQKFYTSK
ncbi:hypothetical protein IJ732_00875 [bacterium]|nr:hypothetical protein [bacterium]